MMHNELTIAKVDPAEKRDEILCVLERNLPEAAGKERFNWLYLDNPDGRALVWLVYNEHNEPVGTSAAIPRRLAVDGSIKRCLVLSDFAIDERLRSLGPALKLLRATLAPVKNGEYTLSYDYPSRSMYAIYKRLGALPLGGESRYVRLLSVSGKVFGQLGRNLLSSVIAKSGDSIIRFRDALGAAFLQVEVEDYEDDFGDEIVDFSGDALSLRRVRVERNAEYLNWRFRRHPEIQYYVAVARGDRDILGYVVFHRKDQQTYCIDELICQSGGRVGVALLNHVVKLARARKIMKIQCSVLEKWPLESMLAKASFSYRDAGTGVVVLTDPRFDFKFDIHNAEFWWLGEGDRDG